jgi:drug/metabolite transporter (DMT)-like permease
MIKSTTETKRADLAMLLVAFIWAFNTPIMKVIYERMSPQVYTGIRFVLISVTSVLLFYFVNRQRDLFSFKSKKDMLYILLAGFFAFFCYQAFLMEGLARTNVFFAAVLVCISPIFAAMLSSVFGIEKITPQLWLGLVISLGGIVLFKMNGLEIDYSGDFIGELYCLGSAFSWAAFTVLSKSDSYQRYPIIKMNTITALFGTILLLMFVGPELAAFPLDSIEAGTWVLIVFTYLYLLKTSGLFQSG